MQWISIKDDKPKENELVWVYTEIYDCFDLAVFNILNGMDVWTGDRVCTWHSLNSSYGKPTHWMIPVPPNDENSADDALPY